jgi:hypothetical protein
MNRVVGLKNHKNTAYSCKREREMFLFHFSFPLLLSAITPSFETLFICFFLVSPPFYVLNFSFSTLLLTFALPPCDIAHMLHFTASFLLLFLLPHLLYFCLIFALSFFLQVSHSFSPTLFLFIFPFCRHSSLIVSPLSLLR